MPHRWLAAGLALFAVIIGGIGATAGTLKARTWSDPWSEAGQPVNNQHASTFDPPASPITAASVEAGALHAQGKEQFGRRAYDKAIELYSRSLALSPAYGDAWHDRGLAHLYNGDAEKAVADLSKAIQHVSAATRQVGTVYLDRARALTVLGQTDQALADYDHVGQTPARFAHQAFTLWRARRYPAAIEAADLSLGLARFSSQSALARGVRIASLAALGKIADATSDVGDTKLYHTDPRAQVGPFRGALVLGRRDERMTLRIMRDADPACEPRCREWIALRGRIERGQETEFAAVLDRLGSLKLPVLIDSDGGSVSAGIAIGRLIRAKDLDVAVAFSQPAPSCGTDKTCLERLKGGRTLGTATDIGALCGSSCVYILAAGGRRFVGPLSLVGVHQMTFYKSYPTAPTEAQLAEHRRKGRIILTTTTGIRLLGPATDDAYIETGRYYRSMDIDDSLMSLLLATPNDGMHWLSPEQLVTTRLQTATGFIPAFFADQTIVPTVVTVPAPQAFPQASSQADLVAQLGRELARLACHPDEAEAQPSAQTVKRALSRYLALTGRNLPPGEPTQEALNMIRNHKGLVCPRACARGTTEREGFCVRSANG